MKKQYKKPNLNAPRFRPKRISLLNRKLYDAFIKKHPEHEELSLQQFKRVVSVFNEQLWNGIIENRDGVELPEGLGFVFIGTCPRAKSINIDAKASSIHGVVVQHKNWDSDNNLMKIFYTNHTSKYPLQNKQVWAFKAVKQFRKAASDAYKKYWTKYITIEPTQKISALFARLRKRDLILANNVIPEDYDEFKL